MYDVLFPKFSWWRRCHVNYDDKMDIQHRGRDPRSWPSWRRKGIQLVAGHMPFGFAQYFPGASEYVTFVREPVSRAVSDYHFCRKNPANPAFAAANRMSLTEFVEANLSFTRNGQTRWLSNAAYGARFSSDEAMLEQAMRNLAQISFVGLTEEFDTSLARLCHRYAWITPSASGPNKNAFTPRGSRLSDEELSVLRRHNSLDMAIYEHCVQRFATSGRASAAAG